jgi:hypothetical protein
VVCGTKTGQPEAAQGFLFLEVILLRIKNYSATYENNRIRELKTIKWIALPIKLDGDGYATLMDEPDGAAIFGAWIACLEVVAKTRGVFIRSSGDEHTPKSLARVTRIAPEIIDRMISVCTSIGWLENIACDNPAPSCDNPAPSCDNPAGIPQEGAALLCSVMSGNVMFGKNPQGVRELSIDPHAGAALDAEIIAAGPPKWANQVQAVFTGLRRARNNGNEIDRTKIIRGAKNYAAKCADENLEPKFIRDVDNWIADGDWGKYQEYNNPNGLMWPEEMERPF